MWHFKFGILKFSLHFWLLLILSRSYWDACQFPKCFDTISSYSHYKLPFLLIFHSDNSQKLLEARGRLGQSHTDSRRARTPTQVCWLSSRLLSMRSFCSPPTSWSSQVSLGIYSRFQNTTTSSPEPSQIQWEIVTDSFPLYCLSEWNSSLLAPWPVFASCWTLFWHF
jgi:hypothetical protein